MTQREQVIEALAPLARTVAGLDLSDPAAARAALEASVDDGTRRHIRELLEAASAAGWLTPKRATPTLTFGRVARPDPELGGCSIDVVDMAGAGAAHTHPNGEVSLCFASEGQPRFCGEAGPFVVVPPGSHHTPEVTGGRMLIAYFLPEGAMEWGPP